MQTSDTSALLATTASSEPSHWLLIIRCAASWKRFVPPRTEAGRSDNDAALLNSSDHAGAGPSCGPLSREMPAVGAVQRGRGVAWGRPLGIALRGCGDHVSQARKGWSAARCDELIFSGTVGVPTRWHHWRQQQKEALG